MFLMKGLAMAKCNRFKFVNAYRRLTAIVEDDSLVVLERLSGKDRVRRVPFDRLGQVVYWRAMPWIRLIIQVVLFLIFTLISLSCWFNRLTGGAAMLGFVVLFSPLAVLFLFLSTMTVVRKRLHLVMYRAGTRVELKGPMSRRKFGILLDEITRLARQTQSRLISQPAAAIAAEVEPSAEPPAAATETISGQDAAAAGQSPV